MYARILRIGSTQSSSDFYICRAEINMDSHNLQFEIHRMTGSDAKNVKLRKRLHSGSG